MGLGIQQFNKTVSLVWSSCLVELESVDLEKDKELG